jgi:hypothetical protein
MKEKGQRMLFYTLLLILTSIAGLLLTATFTLFPHSFQKGFSLRKPLTGVLFTFICVVGIVAVFFPSQCSGKLYFRKTKEHLHAHSYAEEKESFRKTSRFFGLKLTHGHHPLCKGFAHHEFSINGKSFCVACTGLLVGASIALPAAVLYFFSEWNIESCTLLFLVLGTLGIATALVQYAFFEPKNRGLRFVLNTFFVLAAFFLLAVIETTAKSILLNLFVVSLTVFWLFTRITLSKFAHIRICIDCSVKCMEADLSMT